METKHKPYGPYEKYFKRPLDLFCGLAAVIVFWWLYLILAILVRVKLGSPVLFTQERPGKDEKIFKMYKFRSMTDARDENGELLPDEVRLTKFGKLLRATSLDELPELWNIFKGDMSIVGPRPQLVRDMVFMTERQRLRHSVRPGLTGWAQVNGRNAIAWEDKLRHDLEYLEQISLKKDIQIIWMTVLCVLRANDVSAEGMDTAEDYGDYLLRIGAVDSNTYAARQAEAKELVKR